MKRLLLLITICISSVSFGQTNNYSLEFDGADDYIIIGDQHNFGINSSSICIWINPKNLASPNQQNILSKSWQGGYKMDISPNSDSLRFLLKSPSDPQEFMIYSEALTINEWVYISVVIDRVNNLSKLYLDGILVDDIDISLLGNLDNSTNLHFGSNYWFNTGQIAEYYNGLIDDVSFWNVALTEQEIQDYMNCPLTGNESGLIGYWNFEAHPDDLIEYGSECFDGIDNDFDAEIDANDIDCQTIIELDWTTNGNHGTVLGATYSSDVPAYNCNVGITELNSNQPKELIKIVNLLGQEVEYTTNSVLIYQYSDGTSEKVFTIED